jgi:hypothetical protein
MRDLEYERNNITFDYIYQHKGIKCKNYKLCKEIMPLSYLEYRKCYLCLNCIIEGVGELIFIDNYECPICLDEKECIKLLNCNHYLCKECFRRCHHYDDDCETLPDFPYPEIEEEYDADPDNPKWYKEYPLIKEYHDLWEVDIELKVKKEIKEEYLKNCPLCRK